MTKHLLTIKDLMEATQLTRSVVYREIRAGRLERPLKIGRLARWRPEAVERFVDKLEEDKAAA